MECGNLTWSRPSSVIVKFLISCGFQRTLSWWGLPGLNKAIHMVDCLGLMPIAPSSPPLYETPLPSLILSSLMAPWSSTKFVTSQSTVGDSDDSLDSTRLFDGKTEGSSDESKLGSSDRSTLGLSNRSTLGSSDSKRLGSLTGRQSVPQMVRDSVQLWEMLWEIS
jgi:hypothetical protein